MGEGGCGAMFWVIRWIHVVAYGRNACVFEHTHVLWDLVM